jgi:hypothetical protein
MLIHVQTKKHKIAYGGIKFHFFIKFYPLQCKLPTKKQSNIHTNNKLPQPHKISRAPKFLVDPLEGPSMRQCGSGWNLGHDPDF